MKWTDYTPQQAVDLALYLDTDHPVQGPLNELDQVCPWPWEPQQLADAPFGMYHCPYCGGMVVAGVPHPDFRDMPDPPDPPEDVDIGDPF